MRELHPGVWHWQSPHPEVWSPGLVPPWLGRLLGMEFSFAASDASLASGRVGHALTRGIGATECVIVSFTRRGRPAQVAIEPRSDSIEGLREALIAAGVKSNGDDGRE